MRTILPLLILALLSSLFLSCNKTKKAEELTQISFDRMIQGSYYHISYFGKNEQKNNIKNGIDSVFGAIDKSISLWDTNSIINKVNDNIITKLDNIFLDNFNHSQRISTLTDGAFDITVGGLVEAYGFARKNKIEITDKKIDSLLKYVGYKNISVRNNRLVKKIPQTKIDFNAIAQGYTTDKISEYLISKGVSSFIVDIGGEVRAMGEKPDKKKWTCAIETPSEEKDSEREYDSYIELKDESIVTSGNYRKFYIENGVKYSHTIDPKTGRSVKHSLLSASVLAKDATTADGLATAFMVMGLDKAISWLSSHPEFEAHFIYNDQKGNYQTYTTKKLKGRLLK